jgi:4-hydroxy-tetrahydrodipicolinate reductase
MKIVLLGYGKMGKTIEECLRQMPQHKIIAVLNSKSHAIELETAIASCDVVIEFSNPSVVTENIKACVKANKPIVVGTTGWYNQIPLMEKLIADNNGQLVYASNFSIGVNLFFAINKYVANLMKGFSNYHVTIDETHHTQKLDAPSGTAITIAQGIQPNYPALEIPIQSHRIDSVIGDHVVSYKSDVDTLQISHVAHNRNGFAMGAIAAAELIISKKGFFQFQELLHLNK